MVDTVQPEGRVVVVVLVGLALVVASVTGQTVVLMAMTDVTVRAGQLVTVGAHEVMVKVEVVKMVEVV
jgi:hypothetical protein